MAVKGIYEAVLDYDDELVADLVKQEIAAGTDVKLILDEGMVSALDTIGQRFSDGTIFVPEMLMAASAMKVGMELIRPILTDTGIEPIGTVVLGTVKGDLHDIGKNIVGMMLEGAGFRLIDLGVDVSQTDFVNATREKTPDIVALSALLTTSIPAMEQTVTAIIDARAQQNSNVSVIVGGPPVNHELAGKIGADGYGEDAPEAVRVARNLINRRV